MGIVEQYILQLNTEKQRLRRFAAALTALSLLVVVTVSWNLRLKGITLANDASCGYAEHRHSESCPVESGLVCGYPEETDAELADAVVEEELFPSELTEDTIITEESLIPEEEISLETPQPEHIHTDDCYRLDYLCGYEEHIHALACYSDLSADIEQASEWEETLPPLTGSWASDIMLVAQSQIGCGESERNFLVADDGQTRNGITRYGQWYGNPYADWSSLFVMFCLNYAEIPQEAIPWSPGVQNMMLMAQENNILHPADDSVGTPGNILFLDTDGNGNADRALIVTASSDGNLTAIGGDWDNMVCEVTLSADASNVLGYINVAAEQEAQLEAQTPQPTEETDPTEAADPREATDPAEGAEESPETTDEPEITLDVEFPEEGRMLLTAQTANIDETLFTWQWQVSEDGNEPWTDIEGAEALMYELADTEENALRYYRLQGHKSEPEQMTFALTRAITTTDPETGTITSGAVSPFSISKNRNTFTIDVYAIPVDAGGDRIPDTEVTDLGSFTVRDATKIAVETKFDTDLGAYHSAYFGTETSVEADNIASVWRYREYAWTTAYLAYQTEEPVIVENEWKDSSDAGISLYLRYTPGFTVTFASEDFDPLTETVLYGSFPTLTDPGTWSREGYILTGWTVDGDEQTVYTYEEILKLPVVADVTYRAKWRENITVSFDLGAYADELYPVAQQQVQYGGTISQYPTPAWKNNTVAMAFAGWYLDEDLTQPAEADYEFYKDTTLYAKWGPKDDGFFIYYMDYSREGETPLVLMTSGVTEDKTAYPYVPGNPPEGMDWDGKWYLDEACTEVYDFQIPVSRMTDHLTGANGRDLYLYPGTQAVCRAIFVTYGTKIDPVTVPLGGTLDLDQYVPERYGYAFAGWTLKDGTPVSGEQVLDETITYYATWEAGYVPFEAILRIENPDDTAMTQADILGTWYAKAGSQIRVNSTYSGTGNNRTGTHTVVCVLDGEEYPVYTNSALTRQATLADAYATYFVYNNSGTAWTDEVNWDDIYTGGELPYGTRPISSSGDTIINFDYMRVRNDVVFTIPNSNSGAYIDVYKLYQNGLITGSVTYTGTKPTAEGSNVSAEGVSGTNISWSYTAASSSGGNNLYTLHDVKYGQRIYEVYPVGASWLTTRNYVFHWYLTGNDDRFSSRREDLSANFFSGSGRRLTACSLTAVFSNEDKIALMYAVECLPGETADFTINNIGYKVQTHLCEVVNHTGTFSQKDLFGYEPAGDESYDNLNSTNSTIGGTSVRTLFGTTYWDYYKIYDGVSSLADIDSAYIFYYNRLRMNIQFSFAYDSDADGTNETVQYDNIAFGESLSHYQFGAPNLEKHALLNREGYAFSGWLDANGNILKAEDWESIAASGDGESSSMIFIAKWEKISGNIVEYYEDVSATDPFETHYFDDGAFLEYPTMAVYPEGWVWQEYGEGQYERFDWDVPMYGEYGVREVRQINGEDVTVNVLRIYGTWDESHTRVVYDPNAAQGGVPDSAPVDTNEYTIWQSEVSVMSQGSTANIDPDMVFAGWLLDRNGIVYQPGDHVSVHWPRTMIFTAQWAKAEEIVHLRYDPNGGTPQGYYPNDTGFNYRKNATAVVWNNALADGTVWYQRTGYTFTGWNTQPDGSGTDYPPGSNILLTDPVTTLYAQWQKDTHVFTMHKVDRESGRSLSGADFDLYRQENGQFRLIESKTTDSDGWITFTGIETATLYKLVEARPPNGYAIMTKEVCFRLTPGTTAVSLEFCDSEGNVISAPMGVSGEYVSGIRHLTLTVANVAGFELPATGGIGTPLYMLCGMILMFAPLVYGFRLRRRYERGAEK